VRCIMYYDFSMSVTRMSIVRGVRLRERLGEFGCLLTLAMSLATATPAQADSHTPEPMAANGGPGSYYMFRSFDTAAPFTPEQQQLCDDHYGPVRSTTASELNAALFAFTGDESTGRVEDQKASYLGPAIACAAPIVGPDLTQPDPDLLEIFGVIWPPPATLAGLSTFDAPCSPAPAVAQPGVLLVNCRGPFGPDPSGRVLGGVATSNSISNPRRVPGAPTGSIWTTYVVTKRGAHLPPPTGGEPPSTPTPSPGLDFYVFRASKGDVAGGSPTCPSSPTATVVGARRSNLYATAPRLSDGRVPDRRGGRSGALTVCFTSAASGRRSAVARIELSERGQHLRLDLSGDCADLATPAGDSLRQQGCNLRVMPSPDQLASGIRGGLLTSNGLVKAEDPLVAADSHVWTLALFAD
jgi:hypothetical protein